MSLARCRDFMQRAAHEFAAECHIDFGNIEGQEARTVFDLGCLVQFQKVAVQLRSHHNPLRYEGDSSLKPLCSCFVLVYRALGGRQAAREGVEKNLRNPTPRCV